MPPRATHSPPDETAPTRRDAGYAVLEAAVTLPAIILVTMMIVQWAIVWHAHGIAQAAAQEALRSAERYQSTAADGRADAVTFLSQVAPHALPRPAVTVTRTATEVTVHVHAHVMSVIPFGNFSVDATATGPTEAYVDTP